MVKQVRTAEKVPVLITRQVICTVHWASYLYNQGWELFCLFDFFYLYTAQNMVDTYITNKGSKRNFGI